MTITLPKDIEETLATLPQEKIEEALLRLAEQHGYDREKALASALQKGVDDLESGRFTEIQSEEDLDSFFAAGRKRVLEKATR